MPAKKAAPKVTKEEKKEKELATKLSKVSDKGIEVEDAKQMALRMMHYTILDDINYRAANKLPNLLEKNEMEELKNGLSENEFGKTNALLEKFAYIYNLKLIASMKSKEIEIKDGLKCRSCGKMSASMRNVQLRAGDEGTGRVLQCTNPRCNAVQTINSG